MAVMKRKKPRKLFLGGRNIAIAAAVLVSCASFALGYLVGRVVTNDEKVEIISYSPVQAQEQAAPEGPVYNDYASIPEASGEDMAEEEQEAKSYEEPAPEPEPDPEPVLQKKDASGVSTPTGVEKSGKILYSVQVGAFRSPEDAEALKKKLKSRGYTVYVIRSLNRSHKAMYRVRVGKMSDRKSAELLALKLKKTQDIEGFVVRTD